MCVSFKADNPLTPVIVADFANGDEDPAWGVLRDKSVRLALYELDSSPAPRLFLTKVLERDTVRVDTD